MNQDSSEKFWLDNEPISCYYLGMLRKYYRSDNRREFYNNRFKEQEGCCAICFKKERLVIDHDHKSGLMRGLLCYKHNTALGLFADDPAILRSAAEYLETHKAETYEEVKIATSEFEKFRLAQELIPQLLNDDSFPSDRARARVLAEKLACPVPTAQSRIRRARKKDLTFL